MSFVKGDILVCQIKSIQKKTKDGSIRNEYEVLEVLEHNHN
jgi:hypothetical protein